MTPLNVLIVEDEFLVADFLASVVEDAGHTVMAVAATADEALAHIDRVSTDLAILDIRLKGERDGVELAAAIRARNGETRFMFITGSGEASTRARALTTQPVAILQKPFRPAELTDILTRVAQTSRTAG